MAPYLRDFLVIAAAGLAVAVVLRRLRLPVVAGLVAAGAIAGPRGLGLVPESAHLELLAETGVVLLLFTIGLEFSLPRLRRIGSLVAAGGTLQVGLTIALVAGLSMLAGGGATRGVFLGFVIALSSTAVVLRILQERDEVDAPHGRFIVGALLFQDLCVVPMMLMIPMLAGTQDGGIAGPLSLALVKAVALVAVTLAAARYLVPRLFDVIDRTRSRELFVLSVLIVGMGTAFLTSLSGLSLALGAFLGGLMLAESAYARRAFGEVLPLRDAFTSLFFISLGMMFDLRALASRPAAAAAAVALILGGKWVVASLSALAMRFPLRTAVVAGAWLAQFGEFGFVLLREGNKAGLVDGTEAALIISAGVLTIFVTPLVGRLGPAAAAGAAILRPLERLLGVRGMDEPAPAHATLSGHVVVVGYGVAGRVVARALKDSGVPYIVIEMNADSVRAAQEAGEPAYYGDICSEETMRHAGVARARALVMLINDPRAAERAIDTARRHAPATTLLVRTRYLATAPLLARLGAADAVVDEVEAGLEMLARVLQLTGTPRNAIMDRVRDARDATLDSARASTVPRRRLGDVADLVDLKIETIAVREGAHAAGRSLAGMTLRSRTGALVVAIKRGGALLDHPDPSAPLAAGDLLYLVGSGEALRRACRVVETGALETTLET
ncbi:MAG: cation:proton antiporter [Deltaproteobacteria bacterium]|nr:cation:proton antiporter [Deltaproteobacteria bacterium]